MTKIALITGGSRGLGRNTALALAAKGKDVIITYHSQKGEAAAEDAEIEKLGRKAHAFQLDSGKIAGFAAFAADLITVLANKCVRQHFDHKNNKTSTGLHKPFAETTVADFDTLLNVLF